MSIPFEKRVKKMQRLVLGTIVAITAISLVISFSSAPAGEREDDDKPAGTLFKVTVPQREFRQQEAKASAYAVYEFINQYGESITRNIIQAIMDRRLDVRQLPGQRGEELRKKTWEMLVLCQDARMKGLTVSDAEVDAEARVLFGASGLESDAKNENYVAFAQTIFGVPVTTFEAMLRDALLIKKNLALETGGSNAKFAEIYQSLIEESRRARVQVAAIDPERFIQDPRPIGPEAIARYFEGYSCPTHHEEASAMPNSQCPKCRLVMQPNKDRFEVPEKVQVEFLLAEFDTFKARQPDPSEEDIKKYYESNKTHFEKPGAASETETKEYKPIEEVKGEIIDKIKGSKARTQAYDEIRKIDLEIGRLLDAKRKALREEVKKELEARPKEEQATLDRLVEERLLEAGATWFFDLQKRFQAQGVELRNDITTAFDRNHLDEAFKFLGKPAKADGERRFKDTWAFTAKAGEIDKAVMETDKGWCVSRLARKIPAYVPDLIEPIRDRIRRELQQKDAIDRAEKLAKTVQDDLKKKTAVSVVARKYGLVFQHSDYFGRRAAMGDQPNLGMSDFALANKVRAKTFPSANPLEAGEVFSIDGSEIGADKKLWRYVVQVEDVVQVPSDSLETDFERQRKEVEQAKLAEHRRERINDIMMLASLEEAKDKPKGGN